RRGKHVFEASSELLRKASSTSQLDAKSSPIVIAVSRSSNRRRSGRPSDGLESPQARTLPRPGWRRSARFLEARRLHAERSWSTAEVQHAELEVQHAGLFVGSAG